MPELLISDPESQDESTFATEAGTQATAGAFGRWRLKSELESVDRVSAVEQFEPFAAHYVVFTSGVTATGVDDSGTKFILAQLAGWTCPAAITAAASRDTKDVFGAVTRLSRFHGGFLAYVHDAPATPSSPPEMVRWLHEESGLTWDQLARTLGVSRRSVHAWAGGQRVSGRNLERLSHVYSTINAIDASSAEDRRHTLFSPRSDMQPNLFDQLVIQARKAVPPRDENALLRRLGIAPAN